MPHGVKPWGGIRKEVVYATMTDLAELAVRLGSIVSFDRRGDVIWWDGFEDTLNKWTASGYGTGNAQEVSTDYARNGQYSAKLTAGAQVGGWARIDHYMPYPVLGKMGFEFSFVQHAETDYMDVFFTLYDGTLYYPARIRLAYVDKKLQYYNSSFGWTDIATGWELYRFAGLFHTLKLVVDFANKEYSRLIVDSTTYDLSGISVPQASSSDSPHLEIGIKTVNASNFSGITYIDDVIVTQNEP